MTLLLLCTLLAGLLLLQGRGLSTLADTLTRPAPGPDPGVMKSRPFSDGGSGPGRLEDYAQLRKRPLFNADRRPYGQEKMQQLVKPVAAPASPGSIKAIMPELLGILRDGEIPTAYVQGRHDDRPVSLRLGDSYHGWTLIRLATDRVVLQSGGRQRELYVNWEGPSRGIPAGPVPRLRNDARKRGTSMTIPGIPSAPDTAGRTRMPPNSLGLPSTAVDRGGNKQNH